MTSEAKQEDDLGYILAMWSKGPGFEFSFQRSELRGAFKR